MTAKILMEAVVRKGDGSCVAGVARKALRQEEAVYQGTLRVGSMGLSRGFLTAPSGVSRDAGTHSTM